MQDYDESESPLEEYVCIDDDGDFFDYQPFVKVDPNLGFTVYDAIRVIDILGEFEEHTGSVADIRQHTEYHINKRDRESAKLKFDED